MMATRAGNPGACAQFGKHKVGSAMRALGRRCGALALGIVILGPSLVHAQETTAAAAELQFEAAGAWQEFEDLLRQNYAYLERDDIDVEAQLSRSRALALAAPDRIALRRLMHQTALTFADPHLIVGPLDDTDYNIAMSSTDLAVRLVDGRGLIVDVRRGSPAFDAELRPGDQIVTVEGAEMAAAAMAPYGDTIRQPTQLQLDYGATIAANGKRVGQRTLGVVEAGTGKARTVILENPRTFARAVSARSLVDLEFVGPRKNIAVLRPNNALGNNQTIGEFDAAMRRALEQSPAAIILDLRETPSGGNTEVARSVMGHFITAPRPYQMHRIPAVEREFTVPRQWTEYVMPRAPHFAGPVFVLHGKWTGSMGEGIVIGMDAVSDAISIGSDMGDLLGGLWNFDLKASGARVDLGGESLFHVDGTPREDYVAKHQIMPASTAPDGTDPAIAAALRLIGGQ